jgi:hypothetical protein
MRLVISHLALWLFKFISRGAGVAGDCLSAAGGAVLAH